MNKRKRNKTSFAEIVEYWAEILDESELSVDFSDAEERCWRCAYKTTLDRCHIVPASLGGEDTPSNLVLLCRRCHREAPNIDDKNFFIEWLKAQKVSQYDTYWTIRGKEEYFQMYRERFEQSIARLDATEEELEQFFREKEIYYTIHFGEGRLNPSTIAGILRTFVKRKEQFSAESSKANKHSV